MESHKSWPKWSITYVQHILNKCDDITLNFDDVIGPLSQKTKWPFLAVLTGEFPFMCLNITSFM